MLNLKECLQGVESVAILGHVRPDGDCIGSCLSLYNYIETYFPKIEAKVYLQDFMPEFLMLKNADKIVHDLCRCTCITDNQMFIRKSRIADMMIDPNGFLGCIKIFDKFSVTGFIRTV